nr:ATP-binding cassette sub-family A member 13 [Mirounga angustirostris]
MGTAGRQFAALLWKNWLCRLRHPVLSLAEFFWPCILFMILTVLRFQEPPRHRDDCFLQARDLPSRGVFPFVQALLCNTGSTCRNTSYAGPTEYHLRSSRFQAAAGRHEKVNDLAFLEEIQDLAEEICEILDKAKILQGLWAGRSKAPDSSPSSSFLAMDLSKTEEVISKLEKLHQQPHIWNFLLLLPRLYANNIRVEDRIRGGAHLLQAALKVLNSTKELLMMEKKLHSLADEDINFFLSFVGFLEKLLPDPFYSPSMPKFHALPSLTETLLNTSHLWVNHLRSLESDPSPIDTQKLLEFGKAVIDKIETLERLWIKNESNNILRFMELVLFEIDPKLLELWMYGISKGERVKLETLSTLLNLSVPEDERVLSKSLNFSQLFHSHWPQSPAVEMDFVHLSETVICSLYEFGFLKQGQVSEALDTVYAIRNASELFSALSEPERRDVDTILTQIYLHVFQDNDSALLLKIYSSCFQYIYKFLSIPSTEPLLSFLAQTSEHILDIIKQFNFQNISKAFAFLYETTGVLEGLSEGSSCQQLLSIFNYLELQAQSLMSTEGPELGVIHATLTGLKQLLMVDEDFRISFFQYMSQLFNGSVEALSGNECFSLDNKNISSVDYSIDRGSSFILPWAQILSNLSANSSMFNELMAVHCTVSWLQMWTEIWGSISQIFQFDMNVFTPLHVGLTQLLDELESDVKISKSCQRIFPTHRPARLILNLFKNVTQADGFHDWDDFLTLRDLWVVLGDALVRVKSLSPDQVAKSLFTMETALRQLKTFPLNTSASREFFYSLLDVFVELSNTSAYTDRNIQLINHLLSNNVTNYGVKFENVVTKLRETMLLLRNVSHDQDLLSCADIFQNVTEFILEDGLLHVNTSQRTLHILAMLNSTFSSEDTISRLKGCIAWVDITNHLYMMYNSSVAQAYPQGNWRSFRDVEDKINSTLKLVTWILNIKGPHCNNSDVNCVNIVLKNVTDFLNAMLTEVFEKEKVPKFEILLTLLNDSTNQVRMIINNLTRDFDFVSQSNGPRFTELILRPIELSDDMPSQFTNLWLHLVALGKEIQKLRKDISAHILENDTSSTSEKFLNLFVTSPKEKDVNRLGSSFYHLASYLDFNFSHDLQNPPQIIPHKIMNAVGLCIQLIRDVFNSLAPSVLHNIPQDPGDIEVFKKVASLLRTLKKTDIDLLVDQLEQMSESLMDFFKNISSFGTGSLGANLLVGLVEKFVDSSHSWNVNHLLKFSRLFPKDDVNAVVDVYYMLPHAVRLLQRGVDKNITEVLKDVYNFTLLHGISISNVTKEDFAIVIKTLLDAVELISEKSGILSEAFTCLPVVWCWNHTTSGFWQNPKLDACKSYELTSSFFYGKVASLLNHLHLSPPGKGLQCLDEGSQKEIMRKMVCVIHELAHWNSILLELSEVFHVKISLVKTVQEFWHKVLPFVPLSENQSNGSISELCPSGPIKQIASQILAKLKNVNCTKIPLDGNILDRLASLNKILNISEGTEASLRNTISFTLEKIMKLPSGDQHLENSTRSLDPPFVTFLDANLTGSNLEASSSFTKKREATYNFSYFEKLGLELEQIMIDLSHDFPIRPLLSEIIKEIQMINSETLQNLTLQLAHFFESLGSSSLNTSEVIEDFLLVVKNWLCKRAKEDDSGMIQTLFLLMANESSTDDLALLTKDIATFLSLLKTISREDNFDIAHLTQLLSQEQLTNFSLIQFLFESFLINSISKLAGSSPEAALNSSDTDLHIMNFMKLTLNQTQSENGERIILPPRSIADFIEQVLKTFFSFLLEENSENRISLLLKGFHKDIIAKLGFVPKDKILEILTPDQFLTTSKEDRLMSIFSSLKEILNHLITSSFILDNGKFYFDHHQGLKFMRGLFNALLRETPGKNKTENNLEFLVVMSQLLFHMNSSEDLLQLSHNLRSALQLVRGSSTELARLMDILVNSPHEGFRDLYPTLREVILSNLTGLLSFINNSFPLRNRATLDIIKRLLGVISRAGGESGAPEPLLEMSDTLTMLVRDVAEMRDLATSVTSTVELVGLATKVARKMATIFEIHSISNTTDTMKFFGSLYPVLRQSVQNVVSELTTLKNVDHLLSENINDLLTPFLDLAFGMIGVKLNISQDSDIVNMSSSTFSYVNQSKDFSDILKEIAEFLTSVKSNLGAMEHLVVAFNNGTRIFAMDSVNAWEEILDSLVPINNIINQIDFLHPNPLPTHSYPQDTMWERTQEVILFLDEMLSQDSMEIGTYLRKAIDLTLEALWSNLEKDDWSVYNLLLTLAQHPDNFLKAIETAGEVSGARDDLSGALFSNTSLIENITHQRLEEAVQVMLRRMALLRKELPLNNSQWRNSRRTLFQPIFESFINATTREKITLGKEERTKKEMADFPYILKPLSSFEQFLKGLIALTEYWQEVPLMDQSVEMCQMFQQLQKPPEAITTLQKVTVLFLRGFVIFAENPSLTKDMLCAVLSCKQGGTRRLILPALQGASVVHDHYQDIQKMWSSPLPLNCEGLSRNLSSSLESFKSSLEHATDLDCECPPLLDLARQHVRTLAHSLEKTWLSGNPVLTFLSNLTVTGDVKVKDLMQNVSKLTHELRSSIHISDETIHSILEANISRSQVLLSTLLVAGSGRCDADVLRLLVALPEDRKSWFAAKELCSLPGPHVYSLIVSMTENLNLRNVIYKILMPSEAHSALGSLLDVVSRLSHLLAKAGHVLEYLPKFLQAYKITALLDTPDFRQAPQHGEARSSAFGSFQFMMKKVCKEQASFFSGSNSFISLPRVNELLGEDKEKFNIPEDSTPFCLNLYQEILQSPNGALVWSFLKPILHGKILYTPNTPEINEVIQKANYTFHFVHKLKTLTETLLKTSGIFQNGGSGQMLRQLQEALRNKFIRNFVESQLHIDVDKLTEKLQTYGGKLDKMFAHGGAGRVRFLGGILVNLSSCVLLNRFQALDSVASLESKARELMRQNSFLASVIFNTSLAGRNQAAPSQQLPPHVTYTIRTSILYSMRTDLVKNPSWKFHPQSLPAEGFKYNYIFVPLQDMIERAIISVQTGQEAGELATQTQGIPYPCHTRDLFLNNVGFFFPLIMMLMWMVSVASMVRKLVYEREIQIEEYMRMMGVHPTVFFLAWFLENLAVLALSSAALAVILKASGIFAHSNACIVFLFLLDFGVSVIMMSYFLSVFFSQANTAALCTSLAYMISFLPYIVLLVLHNRLSVVIQTLLCLLSTTAFGQGVFLITFLEGQETGVQCDNIYQAPEQMGMTFGWVCWMILFDSGLYFLCGWYLSNLIPGTFGLRKPWHFPFTASYWKNLCGLVAKRPHAPGSDLSFINEHFDNKGSLLQNGEGKPGGGPPGVALVSVTKEYEPHKAAVQDLTLTFHRDQITALLGTNGAGKTTVISMLTGLYAPTSGTIIINGKNLQTDLSSIRRELGVCLQQDVLFDNLTVREHLLLFASIKAPQWTWKELHQQVSRSAPAMSSSFCPLPCGAPAGTPPAGGSPRPLAQARALLVKRLWHTCRAWKVTLSNLLLPVLFVALAMALFMVRPLATDYPPLKLTPGHYDRAEAYFFSSGSGSVGQELAHVLLRKFGDQDPPCADLNPDLKNSSCWHVDPLSQPRVQDSCGCLKCPNASAGAPYLTNHLGHTLLNLSAFHLEEYLLVPSERPRLGGWSFGVQIPDQVQEAKPNTSQPDTLVKVWYNQKGFHSLPSYLNHLNNLILWRHLPPDQDWRKYGIMLYSHPYGGALLNEDKILETIRQCGVALCIVLGFSILSASIGSAVVRDRVSGAKRLQHVCGLGYRTYWLTNFLYDMVFYLVAVSLCVTIIVAFQLRAFTFRENLAATALLLALFGYATLPWMYLMSRIFSSSDVAFISYVSLNFIFGLCTMLMTIMPRLLATVSKAQNLQNIYDVLKWVFTIFPQFCLGQGLIELCYNQIKYDLTHNFGIDSYVSPFEMNFLGWIFVQLASQGTVLLLLRILLHWDLLQRPRGQSAIQGTLTSSKDLDVEKEQIRVLKGRTSEDLLVLHNLSKSYGSCFKRTTAVRGISLGIRRGECFGLLGPNGAGKSTTFKMLNGDAPPTSGHAVARTPTGEVVDLSLAGAAGVRIGYCPQQDALDELLTGWEHLHYYCCLRGIPKPSIPQVAGDLVRRLHLEGHVDKLVATYSGGTKRKLSTALALLGKPDLLLLDEPSSGMDPCSKRYLWATIMEEARGGCAVVLTSHRWFLGAKLLGCVGQRLNLLEYHVPKRWECLADLFRVLENNKTFLNIKHYSINQTTLEQVFINFATEQQKSSQSTVATPTGSHQPPHLLI